MPRTVVTGEEYFAYLSENNYFYIDKTKFILDWWQNADRVTLITRPRRFGKTLMLDTVRTFFAPEFAGQTELFAGLEIWNDEKMRKLQGNIPVIFISFSNIKHSTFRDAVESLKRSISRLYRYFKLHLNPKKFSTSEKELFASMQGEMSDVAFKESLLDLSEFLYCHYHKKPIILLDEYDTPFHEAWHCQYWPELVNFMRSFFNSTFKSNPYVERSLLTGITKVAKESIFSDLNNLKVSTVTTDLYDNCFGFTEKEVFEAMDEYGLDNKSEVKKWYDGFNFGCQHEIYNPWSIINFLAYKKLNTYWADSSSNALVSDLLAKAPPKVKERAELVLNGKSVVVEMDEQIDFKQLYHTEGAIWSLLMSAGYVKPLAINSKSKEYELTLTNLESKIIFENKISQWFMVSGSYEMDNFLQALLKADLSVMNILMSEIVESSFSYFDTKNDAENKNAGAESFYHGFVLGLLINLKDRYNIISNHESGYGRYDICMYPKEKSDPGIIIEFKSINQSEEKNLRKICTNALKQIKEKNYINDLLVHSVAKNMINVYGFAFQGKKVLICGGKVTRLSTSRKNKFPLISAS